MDPRRSATLGFTLYHQLTSYNMKCIILAPRVAYLNGSKAVEAPPVELIQFVNNEVKKVSSDLFTTSILEVCFYTDDIDSAYKHLVDNNVECLSEPQYFDFRADGFGESRAFYFRDPDGIILEMMQPL